MAILNVTPDSFYAGSRAADSNEMARKVRQFVDEGADFIDIGACSTRPGAVEISVETEIDRLAQGMKVLREIAPEIPVSVDTFRPEVADYAVRSLGCDMVNDVFGVCASDEMLETVARLKAPYVMTHGYGFPDLDEEETDRGDIVAKVLRDFAFKLRQAHEAGINDIIVDPGIGFSKNIRENYDLLSNLPVFETLGHPLLVGVSRKRLVARLTGRSPEDALNATTALHAACLMKGAAILRVHDVREARECIAVCNALRGDFSALH